MTAPRQRNEHGRPPAGHAALARASAEREAGIPSLWYFQAVSSRERDWQVLLIGGPSGVGKTTLAHALGRRLGVNVTQLDDVQVALEAVVSPEQQPLLHFWRTNWPEFAAYNDAEHVQHFLAVSRTVFEPAIEAIISDRLDDAAMPAIIEGDFILPELMTRTAFGDRRAAGRVRGLIVDESDEGAIAANFTARHGGDVALPAHANWLKSQWLRAESARLGVPVAASRPWTTSLDRAIDAIWQRP
jgi:2-phosphoglycerate kinase